MIIQTPALYTKKGKILLLEKAQLDLRTTGMILLKGKNGSGKTTLMKEIFRSQPGLFAMLCQENDLLYPGLSVIENIDMYQGNKNTIQKCMQKNGLTHLLAKPAKGLSGGESRLVLVLRALFSSRPCVILDEPSNDIDYQVFEILFRIIKEFATHKAVVIVSHDDRFVNANQVYEIQNHKLIKILDAGGELRETDIRRTQPLLPFEKEKHNPILLIYCALMFLILGCSFISGVSSEPASPYTKYPPNTYRIASLLGTNISDFNDMDGMNTILLQAALKVNKLEYLRKVKNMPEKIGQSLELDDKTITKLYPLEYYNPIARQYWNVEQVMASILAEELKVPSTDIFFRKELEATASNMNSAKPIALIPESWKKSKKVDQLKKYGYFVQIRNDAEGTFTFDFSRSLYEEALTRSAGAGNLLVDAIVIKRDNVGFVNFLESNGLVQKAYLIQGNDVYQAFNESNRFLQWYIAIRSLTCDLILAFACLAIILYIFERSRIKRYRILFYYGYSIDTLVNRERTSYLIFAIDGVLLFLSIVTGTILYIVFKRYFIIGAVLLFSIAVKLSCNIAWTTINKRIWRIAV